MRAEVLVVGAGPAGLATAARLAEDGHQVRLLARGNGFTHWGAGGVDVLGRIGERRVEHPLDAIGELPADHPYRLVGAGALRSGLDWFRRTVAAAGLEHAGDPGSNRDQVTTLGTLRPTCLLPAPAAGELGAQVAVVGFEGFRDFSPPLCPPCSVCAPATSPGPTWSAGRACGWSRPPSRRRASPACGCSMPTAPAWPASVCAGSSVSRRSGSSVAATGSPPCAARGPRARSPSAARSWSWRPAEWPAAASRPGATARWSRWSPISPWPALPPEGRTGPARRAPGSPRAGTGPPSWASASSARTRSGRQG